MTVRLRFTLLFGLLLLGFGGALLTLHWLQRQESVRGMELLHQSREQQLDHWLAATGRSLGNYASENARATAARLRAHPDESVIPETGAPADSGITAYWIVRSNGALTQLETAHGLMPPPVPAAQIAQWTANPPSYRFFSESDAGLLEICLAPVAPEEGAPPWGWVLAARRWNDSYLRMLAALTEGRVSLDLYPAAMAATPTVHTRLLPDAQGKPLRSLLVSHPPSAETTPPFWGATGTATFFVFGVLLIIALAISLQQWVLQPVKLLEAGLAQGTSAPLAPLLAQSDEIAGVARMLETSFAQRDVLQKEIEERRRIAAALLATENDLRRTLEERTRIGRDLHDGVIQTLYATGMGLTGIRALLQPGQTEAAERLDQSRATLNEIIRDVRNFITGLEPETLRQQSFTHAVSALLDFMKNISPVTTGCTIDEELAGQLTLGQRANALHIMREAVSNALRHGAAEHIQVSLTRTPEGEAALEISDDGLGFNPDVGMSSRGRGLENFARRAEELGATFSLRSEPGRGAHLRFVFKLPHPA
jgi:signal transduction histidine kinase